MASMEAAEEEQDRTMGRLPVAKQAALGMDLFAAAAVEIDKKAAQVFKDATDAKIATLDAEAAALTGKENKNACAEKSKYASALKVTPEYIDATRILKDKEPRNGNFVKVKASPKAAPQAAAAPALEEAAADKDFGKDNSTKAGQVAGSSPAERQEFESSKQDTTKKKNEFKETGMSEGQMNEEESIVTMVTMMHELQEKEDPGCPEAAKPDKRPQCFESGKTSMPSTSGDSFSESTTASQRQGLRTSGGAVAESAHEGHCDSGRLPTGLVHAMGIEHSSTGDRPHPECKERVCAILTAFEQEGLRSRCQELDLRSARHEELERAHARAHVQNMARVSNMSSQELEDLADTLDSVYLTTGSFRCASDASGAVIELVEKVVYGELSNGFAVVRPPGHHAESNEACGFCVFNHVAVAAEAIKSFGVGRVLIVDWDIHHGNGTQEIFESDPDVLVFNIHRYDNAQFFPCSKAASPDMVGKDPAEGFNVNVAWNVGRGDYEGMGDDEYLAAWQCALLPIAFEFQPEFILISAGFDATEGDPLGGCSVTPALYAQMTQMLQTICPKVVLVLEGGYNLSATAECAVACARALLGDPVLFRTSCRPKKEAMEALRLVSRAHRPFWFYLPDSFALRDFAIPVTEMATFAEFMAAKHGSQDI